MKVITKKKKGIKQISNDKIGCALRSLCKHFVAK